MTTGAINKAYKSIEELTEKVSLPHNKSKATTIIQFIEISTSKKSLKVAQKILDNLTEIKNTLPNSKDDFDIDKIKSQLQDTHENLFNINSMFEFIKKTFDIGDSLGINVEVENETMIDFLAKMSQVKTLLEYISDFLQLVVKIHKDNTGEKKIYSCDEITALLKAS